MKIRSITLRNVAGYRCISWNHLQPDLNFLLGRNGVGKTTILQALSFALSAINDVRTEDLLTKTYRNGVIELQTSSCAEPLHVPFNTIRISQGNPNLSFPSPVRTLYFVENRQPKNTVGDDRSEFRTHPSRRYPNAITELKFLLGSNEADRKCAKEALDICRRLGTLGRPEDWKWIEGELPKRSSTKARPTSCGQFDAIALALDLVRFRDALGDPPTPGFVLLDNPETYLHPACQESVLSVIREMLPDAQIFIASHSLKLLCHRDPRSVFWLNRDHMTNEGSVHVESVRELERGAQLAFFDLYGDDVSSAVLSILRGFETPEYYRFLYDCTVVPEPEMRRDPGADRQVREIAKHLSDPAHGHRILDVGAGHGDLLVGLMQSGAADRQTTYVACDSSASRHLQRRLAEAIQTRKISPDSHMVTELPGITETFDTIVLCNVCHEIPLPDLAMLLGALIRRLRCSESARLLIHEVETLGAGERKFVMWTPDDYQHVFSGLHEVQTTVTKTLVGSGVPLNTTVVTRPGTVRDDLESHLIAAFWRQVPIRRADSLAELERLWGEQTLPSEGLTRALRQRRAAFLVAQIATLDLLERSQTAASTPIML